MTTDATAGDLVELLERVIEAQGRLLGVSHEPVPGGGARRLVLRFDVDTVSIEGAAGLTGSAAEPGGNVGGIDAGEEEPWWAVLGNPLARVERRDDGSLLLQFRADHESPRIFGVRAEAGTVRVQSVI